MSAHTPGPWIRYTADGLTHAILPAGGPGVVVEFKSPPMDEADARLIAAAPDGLAAADEALACLMDHTRGQADAIRMLKTFLAKARGE